MVIAEWVGAGQRQGFESKVVLLEGHTVDGVLKPFLWLWKCPWHAEYRVYAYPSLQMALVMHRQMVE